MRAEYVEAVLDVAELIPPQHVLSYGDIAALLERGGPRQVGAVMSKHGSAVSWWRVIRASGEPPQGLAASALVHYREESTVLRGDTSPPNPSWRVDMTLARWNPTEPEFERIDAIAARLHEQEIADSGRDMETVAKMSEAHDGLQT